MDYLTEAGAYPQLPTQPTFFLIIFKLIQQSIMVILSCLMKKNQNLNLVVLGVVDMRQLLLTQYRGFVFLIQSNLEARAINNKKKMLVFWSMRELDSLLSIFTDL